MTIYDNLPSEDHTQQQKEKAVFIEKKLTDHVRRSFQINIGLTEKYDTATKHTIKNVEVVSLNG